MTKINVTIHETQNGIMPKTNETVTRRVEIEIEDSEIERIITEFQDRQAKTGPQELK